MKSDNAIAYLSIMNVGSPNAILSFLAPKLLLHAQNSSHDQFSCRFYEPMSRAQ